MRIPRVDLWAALQRLRNPRGMEALELGADAAGRVRIDFPCRVRWISFEPAEARRLAAGLLHHADVAEGKIEGEMRG